MDAELLSGTFVALADTLVDDFDVIEFLGMLTERSVRLLPVTAAGVLLADPGGRLRAVAGSSEAAGLVDLLQIQDEEGPCLDCLRTGRAVTADDLQNPDDRWPRFAPAAVSAGFRTVQALPLRLRDEVIGALNLFGTGTSAAFSQADLQVAQALADVATIGLLQERSVRRSEIAAEQLQGALNSRVVIEQAKGKLAERLGVDMEQAFRMLREHARNTNQRLTDVARDVAGSAGAELPPPARSRQG